MQYDGATDYLHSVKSAWVNYRRAQRKAEEQREQCENVTANWNGAPGGGGDPHKDAPLVALAQASAEEDRLRRIWEARRDEVEQFLSGIPDERYRIILWLRYADQMTWPEIAKELEEYGFYYAERHVTRLHGEALAAVRELWQERYGGDGYGA